MSLRMRVNGMLNAKDLDRLQWPIAWSGTVSAEQRSEEESDLAELISECLEALREWPDAEAVEIVSGEIVSVVMADYD